MVRKALACACLLSLALLCQAPWALAHGIIGKRLFVEPLFAEDANPKTELDFPVFETIHRPDRHISTFGYSFEYRIAPRWSVEFDNGYDWLTPIGGREISGFDNAGFGVKYSPYRNEKHEFAVSSALHVEAPTGRDTLGVSPYTVITPGLLYAKGLGDLPDAGFAQWLRPLAIQGDFTLDFPAGGPQTPGRANIPHADLVVEYSVPYLNAHVRHASAGYSLGEGSYREGHSAGAILGDMFPFVEVNFEADPYKGGRRAYGYYRPGIDYVGHYFQVGIAAELPANSATGKHLGAVGIFDIFVDEAVPKLKALIR